MNQILVQDKKRYKKGKMPLFQFFYRKAQEKHIFLLRIVYRLLFSIYRNMRHIEMSHTTKIGGGLYFGHPFGITINPNAIIGECVNLHKGVTIGQENRGERKGAPVIGNNVWIGVNATVVGKIEIGNDVLIAPNSFVNKDIPDHSIVIGNPCIIKKQQGATKDYINEWE